MASIVLLFGIFSADLKAGTRVEFCFSGDATPSEINGLKNTIAQHNDYVFGRISVTGRYFMAEFEQGSPIQRNDFVQWLNPLNLSLDCYFQSDQMAADRQAYEAYQSCKSDHIASGKMAAFNTCATPVSICDGDPLAVTPWGPGTTITTSPDPPRNPEYDPYYAPSPWLNPWLSGTNWGCLQSGEQNTIWIRFVVSSAGNLEWAFSFPEVDALGNFIYMDWSVFNNTPGICTDIALNTPASAPVRCNWNDWPSTPIAYTGMASAIAGIPDPTETDNFELSVPAVAGQEFLLLLDNWSGGTFTGGFDLSLSASSAGVCSTVLPNDHTELRGLEKDGIVELGWFHLGPQAFI
ncbi:MAG: hypothetical protein AAF570_28910, partial [Bacteroidota bacterium]